VIFEGKATERDDKPRTKTYFWQFEMPDGKVVRPSAPYDSIAFNDLWTRVASDK